jgi:hypothetical protein
MNSSLTQHDAKPSEKNAPAFEKHYSPEALGEQWGLSADTVRRIFEHEPGVLVIQSTRKGARRYRTIRIPESIAVRAHRRLSNSRGTM